MRPCRVSLTLFAALLAASGCHPGKVRVRFSAATLKPAYQQGESIDFALTLEAMGSGSVSLSPLWNGNIEVVSLTRDGVPVTAARGPIDFEQDLGATLQRSLKTISSGKIAGGWRTYKDVTVGGQALQTVTYDPSGNHQANVYPVGSPGKYQLSLVYKYPGPTGNSVNVYTKAANTVHLTFTVKP